MDKLYDDFLKSREIYAQYEQDKTVTVSDSDKYTVYGLQKQVLEGNCTVSEPPNVNIILHNKWKAWSSCYGYSKEQAMKEYIQSVADMKASSKSKAAITTAAMSLSQSSSNMTGNTTNTATSSSAAAAATTTPMGRRGSSGPILNPTSIKEGVLYKQRDFFSKNWRTRHFVLEDSFLHYYVDVTDPTPRNSMSIEGCVISHLKPIMVGDNELYPFTIKHEKANDAYTLASDSKVEADDWVDKIRMAVNNATFNNNSTKSITPRRSSNLTTTHSTEQPLVSSTSASGVSVSSSAAVAHSIPDAVNPLSVYEGISNVQKELVDSAVSKLLEAVDANAPGWEPLFDKSGVVALKRPGENVCVRGDGILQYSLLQVFKLIMMQSRASDINPQIVTSTNIRQFSLNTNLQYLRFKQVWPTAPRDFCNLTHWRYFTDNRVCILSFAYEADDVPAVDGVVRGELLIGGYVLTPVPTGTLVQYVVSSDLKGNIPATVRNYVSSTQPLIVANIRKVLDQDAKGSSSTTGSTDYMSQFTYDELCNIKKEVQLPPNNPFKATSSGSSTTVASTSDQAATKAVAGSGSVDVKRIDGLHNSMKARKSMRLSPFNAVLLFIPLVTYYIVDRKYRAYGFLIGIVLTVNLLIRLYLGEPVYRLSSHDATSLFNGKIVVRFPIDLTKLLMYLNHKREETGLEITITHIVIKSIASVLHDSPNMNGNIAFGHFYKSNKQGVTVSASVDTTDKDTTLVLIEDADIKPLDYVAEELLNKSKELRSNGGKGKDSDDGSSTPMKTRILQVCPIWLKIELERLFKYIGVNIGISVPALGIIGFPYGSCVVVTSPNREGDGDVDVAMIPNVNESSAPITLTVGGIRILPSFDTDRKLVTSPALNLAVSIDSRACSLIEGRRFCAKLQNLLNNLTVDKGKDKDKKKK